MSLLHLAILSPFLMAILVPFFYQYFRKIHTGWFVLGLPVVLFIYFLNFINKASHGEPIIQTMEWIPSLGVSFTAYLDGLSLLFVLLITGIGSLVILYSIYYLSKTKEALNTFYVYLLMFMGAMLGVVLSDNVIVLYTFWELTSLSSFLLIGYWYNREKSRYGAQKSMLITVFGGLAMLGGFILLSIMTETFSIREMAANSHLIAEHRLFIPAMLLILAGAFTKSAQFPFHIWLPDAMEAPTPVSSYLHSATMVKAGIYLVARLSPIFAGSAEWFWIVSGIGIVTLFWGSFSAVKQTDLKAILAFSTVSQLGMIMSLLGLGSAALHFDHLDKNIYLTATVAAVFHLINHATFKGSLFMVAGIVDHETGTRDIRKLGGLMNFMPITFTIATIGAFSMAGLPPFNGFLSKEMFFTAIVNAGELELFNMATWGILFPIIAWIASVFTFIYSMILVFKTFSGSYKPDKLDKKPHEAPIGMLIPPIILASLVVIFGFFANILTQTIIEPAIASIQPSLLKEGGSFHVHIEFWHGWTKELYMTIGVILAGSLLYYTLAKWSKVYSFLPKRLTLNNLYDHGLVSLERSAKKINDFYMTGFIRNYLVIIFGFMILALATTMILKKAVTLSYAHSAPVGLYEVVLSIALVAATITILFTKSRLTAIIALGAVGYAVSLFFVLFRAPDLALTQLIVETVSVALFLLCFYHLPKLKIRHRRLTFRLTNLLISLGVGIIVTLIAISSSNTKLFESIADYFVEASYKEAGGKNMVNVILVDFRGFDTMFEIAVLGIASLGIFSLIKLRLSRGKEG